MYTITATRSVARIRDARAGRRGLRRNPLIVMKDGSTIRIAPGKSVTISEEAYNFNKKLLEEFSKCIIVRNLNPNDEDDTIAPPPVPPYVPEDEDEAETLDDTEEISLSHDVDNESIKVEETVTTTKRRRRSSQPKVESTEAVTKPKRRRRSRKSDNES